MKRAAVVLTAAGLALSGCGAPAAELFVVTRSGSDRNANLTMLVSDDGTVTCNEREPVPMGAKRLLDARELARDLQKQAALGLELPRGRGAILAYRARLEAGTIAFSDTSRGRPGSFNRLVAFTNDIARGVCKLRR